ncbi:hypothetical protein EYR41_010442 [Orbilia oligospora]|uniref:Uncharacterized protein n=1 Tax=Orbilia oligospora TaxID=2813651 RepID=A0A7C8U899_ORBOL|nr:hypothetical protein TWF751_000071 [Orbilia oligospora]TGJ64381.1 hypothetical protein EYR41_010442 [Orbilia oligospora]
MFSFYKNPTDGTLLLPPDVNQSHLTDIHKEQSPVTLEHTPHHIAACTIFRIQCQATESTETGISILEPDIAYSSSDRVAKVFGSKSMTKFFLAKKRYSLASDSFTSAAGEEECTKYVVYLAWGKKERTKDTISPDS